MSDGCIRRRDEIHQTNARLAGPRFVPFYQPLCFVPFALTVLAGELYNILAFHITMAPGEIAPGLLACVLWVLVFLQYRGSFRGIFQAKPAITRDVKRQPVE